MRKILKKNMQSMGKRGKKIQAHTSSKKSASKAKDKAHPMRVFVAAGSRSGHNPEYAQQAYELGREIGRHNYQLTFGWSSIGIMGAVAQGVLESWSKKKDKLSKPLQGITTEHYLSLYTSDTKLDEIADVVVSRSLEERKKNLLQADFIVFAPGGLGTLDELAYDCITMQDGALKVKPFVLFNVGGFFHHLLEFLKDIHLKGFSDQMPFIVADNVFEIQVSFAMIAYYQDRIRDKTMAAEVVAQIIHELPYVIEQQQAYPRKSVERILQEKESVFKKANLVQKQELSRVIEEAYLKKEIQRMYDRLSSTSRDTALASHKLDKLRERIKETKAQNGFC